MAVYFQPRQRSFWEEMAPSLMNLAIGQIEKGFERGREARAGQRLQQDFRTLDDAMRPRPAIPYSPIGAEQTDAAFGPLWDESIGREVRGDVNDFTRLLGSGNIAPQNISTLIGYGKDFLRQRFENQEKARFADETRADFLANGGINRNDPSQTAGNFMGANIRGGDVGGWVNNVMPNMKFDETNLGDKKIITAQNPLTGEVTPAYTGVVSVSPDIQLQTDTQKRGQDTNLKIANISSSTQRYVHGTPSGTAVYNAKQKGAGGKPMTTSEKNSFEMLIYKQVRLAKDRADLERRIAAITGGDPERVGYANMIVNSPNVLGEKSFTSGDPKVIPNRFYIAPEAIKKYRQAFPKDTKGMSDEQVMAEIAKGQAM